MKLLACQRLDLTPEPPGHDFEESYCDNCNCPVWLGPSQAIFLAHQPDSGLACVPCAWEIMGHARQYWLASSQLVLVPE